MLGDVEFAPSGVNSAASIRVSLPEVEA